jgi:integrase
MDLVTESSARWRRTSAPSGSRVNQASFYPAAHAVAWVPEAKECRPVAETRFRRKKCALRVAFGSRRRRHQNPEVPPHANWTSRELRHSFVSLMSDNGVTIEQIAELVGHRATIATQKAYRHQPKPLISTGATAMNVIFGNKKRA